MRLRESAEFAIANVQCQYDSSDTETEPERVVATAHRDDHTYDTRDEPPAFIIHHVPASQAQQPGAQPFVEVSPKIMTIGPSYVQAVNVIHVGDRPQAPTPTPPEYNINKRIRRSEVVLRQAAECVSRGHTFQTVSEQFNIPISTIRFFMARKGILPRRRRGRNSQLKPCSSPEPPFHMQHFKLPDMVALKDCDEDASQTS